MPRKSKTRPAKLDHPSIDFSVVKRSVYVVGRYNPGDSLTSDRLAMWQAVSNFGLEIAAELAANYKARITRLVHFETRVGEIVFDVASTASMSNRRRAVETVQHHYAVLESSVMLKRPDSMQ